MRIWFYQVFQQSQLDRWVGEEVSSSYLADGELHRGNGPARVDVACCSCFLLPNSNHPSILFSRDSCLWYFSRFWAKIVNFITRSLKFRLKAKMFHFSQHAALNCIHCQIIWYLVLLANQVPKDLRHSQYSMLTVPPTMAETCHSQQKLMIFRELHFQILSCKKSQRRGNRPMQSSEGFELAISSILQVMVECCEIGSGNDYTFSSFFMILGTEHYGCHWFQAEKVILLCLSPATT